jgi:hypothetical protein
MPSPYFPSFPSPVPGQTQQPSPATPATPSTPGAQPTTPTDQTTPGTSDAFSQAPAAGTEAAATFAPNMFGDQFGGGSGSSVLTVSTPSKTVLVPGVLNGQKGFLLFQGATFQGPPPPQEGIYTWPGVSSAGSSATFIGPTGPIVLKNVQGSFTQNGQNFALNPNAPFPTPSASARSFVTNQLAAPGQPLYLVAQGIEQQANPKATLAQFGATLNNLVIGPVDISATNFPLEYGVTLQSTVSQTVPGQTLQFLVHVPNPSGGGTVGRIEIAEDINPLPRDRFIFDYDFFSRVPLGPGGWDVNRFVFGYEKTFFDEQASVEVRLPFAATLNNDFTLGAESTHVELGNVRVLLKALLFGNDQINIAGGLGIHVPTAPNTRVSLADGTPLVQIRNETVILSPFLGALFTPNPRLFAQAWLAFDVDPRGNPVAINPDLSGLTFAGRLHDASLLQIDGHIGYWLIQSESRDAVVRGVAPFVELHYDRVVGNANTVSSGSFVVTGLRNDFDQLDLTAGVVAQLGDRLNLSMGVVAPLLGQDNRTFDWQLGVRANVFLGPTGQRQNNAYYAP